MAKTTKKAFAGMTSNAPTVKKTTKPKKPTTNKTDLVSFGYGKYGQAMREYEKAKRGGAAKTAKKLAPDERTVLSVNTRSGSMFNPSTVTEVASRAADRKLIAQQILNDKSKKITRARIAEMNAKKKASKPKSKSPSNASKVKDFFKEKPKYTSEVIVWNKKMDAAEAARKKKK